MKHRDARAGRASRRWVLTVPVLVLVAATAPTIASAAAEADPAPTWTSGVAAPKHKGTHVAALDPALHDDAEARRARPSAMSAGDAVAGDSRLTVVVEAVDAAAARAAVEAAGGTVDTELTDRVRAEVPAGALDSIAASDGVVRVREPFALQSHVTSEGVDETQGSVWHTGGLDGTGTKVAIVDGGFTDYASRLGTELPASVETDFTRCPGGAQDSEHGTAVAEIVHDMAPGATLRLVCIEDDIDYVSALGTMNANGVDVVNGSFGFLLSSRGDGSGGASTINGATAALRDQGILYVASAGNSGQRHYNVNASGDKPATSFPDPDDDSYDDFVNISDGDALEVTVPGNGVVFVGLRWDAWPTTSQDFDLLVGNNACGLVGQSTGVQNGSAGSLPVEGTVFQNCSSSTRVFEVVVNRWDGTANPRLDFFFDGAVTSIEHVTGGSIADPATSPAAMAVAAHCETTGTVQPYSSRGPTIDGRIKPDISGPDGTSSSVYGGQSGCSNGFTGTSASAPHVAGAAALVLDANPLLDVAELQQLLEDRAQDAGSTGDDNVYGTGRMRLGVAGAAYRPAPQAFTPLTPTRLYDSRPGTQYPGEMPNRTTPVSPNSTIAVPVRGLAGVPADAVAVALNVTVVQPTASGWLTIFPDGVAPNASNINFSAGRTTPVHVTATVGASNSVRIYNSSGNTHVLVDIAGWYGPTGAGGPSTDRLTPLAAPARAMDTRPSMPLGYAEVANGDRTTAVGALQTFDVPIAGLGGVPADATAVITNVTAIAPSSGTFLTVFPTGSALPTTSNLNPRAGQIVANLVVVPVGTDGSVSFYNAAGNAHLAIDVLGYFRAGSGAGYVALDPPTRQLDTRTGTGLRRGSLGPGVTHSLKVARYDGVPADAAAVMLSAAAVSPTAGTYFTIFPSGSARPNTSNINVVAGSTLANAVLARIDGTGRVSFFNAGGSAHVISDLAGYFIDPANVQLPPL